MNEKEQKVCAPCFAEQPVQKKSSHLVIKRRENCRRPLKTSTHTNPYKNKCRGETKIKLQPEIGGTERARHRGRLEMNN